MCQRYHVTNTQSEERSVLALTKCVLQATCQPGRHTEWTRILGS